MLPWICQPLKLLVNWLNRSRAFSRRQIIRSLLRGFFFLYASRSPIGVKWLLMILGFLGCWVGKLTWKIFSYLISDILSGPVLIIFVWFGFCCVFFLSCSLCFHCLILISLYDVIAFPSIHFNLEYKYNTIFLLRFYFQPPAIFLFLTRL